MNTLTVRLKQHTPLIHFQHDQEGATLRASEVKPKLDKFILTELGNGDYKAGYEIAKSRHWLVGKGDHPALNYKMRIVSLGAIPFQMNVIEKRKNGVQQSNIFGEQLWTTPNYPDSENSLIMGNMGGRAKEDVLNFVMFENISLYISTNIVSVYNYLINEDSKLLYDFFVEKSFGNRTSKGFGCFFVTAVNDKPTKHVPSCDWSISFHLSSESKESINRNRVYKDVFIIIHRFWKWLKRYSKAPRNEMSSVFLKICSNLTENEERIPSPVYFKPRIRKKEENVWVVDVMIFLNKEVISSAGADMNDFYDLLDGAVGKAQNDIHIFDKTYYSVTNLKIQ